MNSEGPDYTEKAYQMYSFSNRISLASWEYVVKNLSIGPLDTSLVVEISMVSALGLWVQIMLILLMRQLGRFNMQWG